MILYYVHKFSLNWPLFDPLLILILVEYQLNMFLQSFGARIFVFSFFFFIIIYVKLKILPICGFLV